MSRSNKGSVYFTRIWLPYFDFQTSGTIFRLPNHAFCTKRTEKRCQSLKIKVGKLDSVPSKVQYLRNMRNFGHNFSTFARSYND